MYGKTDRQQSLPVVDPDPEMPILQTPGAMSRIPLSSGRRKLPTPPLTDARDVEEHTRKTIERLREQRAFRRHVAGAQGNESESDISVIGLQNLKSLTAPVVSGRKRIAASFPVSGDGEFCYIRQTQNARSLHNP